MKRLLLLLLSIAGFNKCNAQIITLGQGNTKNVVVTSSSNDNTGVRTLNTDGYLPNSNSASRFLSQATLGHNIAQIQDLTLIGNEQWLTNQFAMPNSFSTKNYLSAMHQTFVDSMNARGVVPLATLLNTNVGDWHFDISWFQGSMFAPDLLRWRVSLALSEIFVTSRVSTFKDNPYALASYYDLLNNNAFGNYRSLIDSITYHPSMAVYLTFMNNHATDLQYGRQVYPDENYAREIMQLFSIGLYKLNLDGSEMKDANNKSIPTYDNNDIANLAKVFTGLSWGDSRYLGDGVKNNWSYTKKLKFYAIDSSDAKINTWRNPPRIVNGHEVGVKTFLGSTIPSKSIAAGETDIQDALNILFNHPNVGPFIARRLIQRLVTSNPSPAYIGRVASIFNNNGNNVRGDLKAVIKAVLLDIEARDCCSSNTNVSQGMLREPFIRYMNIMKGLPITTLNGKIRNTMYDHYNRLEQVPLYAPSVFNFFQPDYAPNGLVKNAVKVAPEFQLLNSSSLTGYFNALNKWIINDSPTDFWSLFVGETYKPDQNPRFNLAADFVLTKNDRLPELLDKYNLLFAHGTLSAETLLSIKTAVSNMPYSEDSPGVPNASAAFRRSRIALYLILSSPDYLINK